MADFRRTLYSRYVSTLKSGQVHRNQDQIDRIFRTYKHRFLPLLIGKSHDDPILELGCGPGYLLEFLRDHGFTNIRGIDISPEQIEIAASQGLPASVADAVKFLSGKRQSFGVIFALDFVEHFTIDELLRLLPLVSRSLKKDGLFIIQTPNGQGLFPGQVIHGDLTHLTIFAQDSLRQILSLSGFKNIQFKETDPVPDSPGGRINLYLWKLVRAVVRIIRQIEANNSSKLWTENMIAWCSKA